MDPDRQDLIILRRSVGQPTESIKSGVWKIAHADFMTAMMALFLVLWLVNSTNRETRTSVAQYFNPIKLSDLTADRKGVRNPQDAEPAEAERPSRQEGDQRRAVQTGPERRPSAVLKDPRQGQAAFDDPYAVLAEVAAAKPEPGSDKASALTLGTTGKPGMNGGEALRDPFDPNFWRQTPQTEKPVRQEAFAGDAAAAAVASPTEPAPKPQPANEVAPSAPASVPAAEAPATLAAAAATAAAKPLAMSRRPDLATPETGAMVSRADDATASAIAAALAKNGSPRPDQPQVDVRRTEEGLLVSLTDNANFGMFGIGSAEPHPQTVAALQRVAAVLKEREGAIIIRGHTDARPFRDGRSDNWRLSTSRAHTAQDLLVQAGISAARIEHIEGYANRRPRAEDPNAAENRRIEILVREKRG